MDNSEQHNSERDRITARRFAKLEASELTQKRRFGRRKYFKPAAERGPFKEMPAISWSRKKRDRQRENVLQLNEMYVARMAER